METFSINNILVLDDMLTPEQCTSLIDEASQNFNSSRLETDVGYNYYDWAPQVWQTHPILNSLLRTAIGQYAKSFPELGYVGNLCVLSDCRLKHFPPGYSYDNWHQEHVYAFPYRIACILVYLTDHNCGTEFVATGETVMSKLGRVLVFPTFWTHTHRGQVCPDGKDRYILGSYLQMIEQPSAYTKSLKKLPK
jgi:hypothetical protein